MTLLVAEYIEQQKAVPDGSILLRRCRSCGEAHWYPRRKCPLCHTFDTEWEACSGNGEIYSFTIMRKSPDGPFVVICVTLDVGPKVFVLIEWREGEEYAVGQRVTVSHALTTGRGALALAR